MKKLLYVLLIAVSAALTITSCTEENVTPTSENGGAGVIDPK